MDISQKKNTITIILKKVDMISGKWKPEKKSGIGEWTTKITQSEKQKDPKETKYDQHLKDPQDTNIHIIGVPQMKKKMDRTDI